MAGAYQLIRSVKWLHVAGTLSVDILCALQPPDKRGTLLPALHKLCIPHPGLRQAPLTEVVVGFMTSRRISGHHVGVEYEGLMDGLCRTGTMHAQCGASTTR